MFNGYVKVLRVIGELFTNLSVADTATVYNGWIPNSVDKLLDDIEQNRLIVRIRGGRTSYCADFEIQDKDFESKVIETVRRRLKRWRFDANVCDINVSTSPVDDGVLIFDVNGQYGRHEIEFEIR